MVQVGTGLSNRAILIEASADVVVYALNKRGFSTDAFGILPVNVLGKVRAPGL